MSCATDHVSVPEPKLAFHVADPAKSSISPLDGLSRWGSLERTIPGYSLRQDLRLAYISTQKRLLDCQAFLSRLNSTVNVTGWSRDKYLRKYPGFQSVFGRRITLPSDQDPGLRQGITDADVLRIARSTDPEIALLDHLKQRIQVLFAERSRFDVLVLHLPQQFASYRRRIEPDYYFDLHDSLKAFCAAHGVRLQILEDGAFTYPEPARVFWWLSLALHVKAGGIPWRLADCSPRTIYVGMAYTTRPASSANPFVLGCSQLFDERGEWLRFVLFPLQNPVWRGRNPFMNRDQARQLFVQVREIYQAMGQPRPQRIVVHKTTYYSSDEMAGIAEATAGVDDVELVTVQQRTRYRAINVSASDGKLGPNMFPVDRGIALPQDGKTFLLWTSGDVLGIAPNGWHHYQEQRNIPTPLTIVRYRGQEDLISVASDVLKLSKMNWNNLQLYNYLPVTVTFAREMARIGEQIDNLSSIPYDFRYFM